MSDHFVFIPSVELSLSGDAKVEVIKVETPEFIAKQLMLMEEFKELYETGFGGKGVGKELAEAAEGVPIMAASAEVWEEGLMLAGWCGSDGKPIFPIDPQDDPEVPFPDPGWGPCFLETEMAAEMGLF